MIMLKLSNAAKAEKSKLWVIVGRRRRRRRWRRRPMLTPRAAPPQADGSQNDRKHKNINSKEFWNSYFKNINSIISAFNTQFFFIQRHIFREVSEIGTTDDSCQMVLSMFLINHRSIAHYSPINHWLIGY